MSDPGMEALARAAGVLPQWTDYRGQPQRVSEATLRQILEALGIAAATPVQRSTSLHELQAEAERPRLPLITAVAGQPVRLPWRPAGWFRVDLEDGGRMEGRCEAGQLLPAIELPGYHRLSVDEDEPVVLAVAPSRCFGPADLGDARRRWGLTAQVYGLRRSGDAGIGDFGGVAMLARSVARKGADAIAISPVHALFSAWQQRYAPYAPSSRLMRNPLLADPAAVFDAAVIEAVQADTDVQGLAATLEALPLMDAARAAPLKYARLAALHARLDAMPMLRAAFEGYCAQAGSALREHACFEVLHAHFLREKNVSHWRDWPAEYRDPRTAAVTRFAQEHAQAVEFQMFAQWLTDQSLAQAQRTARDAGMAIGLVGDLAVGTDGGGSHAWGRQRDMLIGLRVGAPPDLLNARGQDWGLSVFSPHALRHHGYEGFIEMLRASLQHVGGVRLDHVFGMQRLWMIAADGDGRNGAYVQYPIEDLLRLVALESWRHRAIVIGEDLGTIPDGFQEQLDKAGLLGMRVLWFQRDHGLFVEPPRWAASAVAMTTTHDLPTVAGWWRGQDIGWRARLDLLEPGSEETDLRVAREQERRALWDAFAHAGVAGGPTPGIDQVGEVACAAAAFIGSTPAALALLPVEDALALVEQPNIPGTTDEHPNWCRRLDSDVETVFGDASVQARLAALDAQRRART